MALEFAHALMYVSDMDNMVDFYTNVLGFTVTDRGLIAGEGSPAIAFLSNNPKHHHQFAFLQVREDAGASNSLNHLAFRADALEDVKGTIEALEADGRATKMAPVTHGNAWSIYFNDPEGNGLEVFCDTPFHVSQPQATSWDPNMDEDELTAWTEETFGDNGRFGPIADFYSSQQELMT
ncbi:MAG: VOC family protein [Actinomycetota bacterium]|jgi:catechol-2,3-dioxygenase|nr:VOC family protein [Acidimicrobiales bacterium]MCS5681952.1 VOC family protein [Acidimicrobiales bacterium]MEC7873356.1 VOC family protein [Actinomycetota bacterium]MEC9270903.1 VOC family protein [Actinomycetota bacterium]|tara:strand:- start:262 stop:798 length:537 start_codon:yes stop_codon:yes gene_type:complete